MGFMFQPSAPEQCDGKNVVKTDQNLKNENVIKSLQSHTELNPSTSDTNSADLESSDIVELPIKEIGQTHDGTIAEFCQQFMAVIPGFIILFACGLQLTWAIVEYDRALWQLFDKDSPNARILIILCYYFGAILGNLMGAVMVLQLRKKLIYFIAAFLLILCGEFLKYSNYFYFYMIGRALLGFTFSIAQLTVVTYASETTTKKIRIGLLSFIGYINAVAVLLVSSAAYRLPQYLTFSEHYGNTSSTEPLTNSRYEDDDLLLLVEYSGLIIMALAMIVLITIPFLVRESIPFLMRKQQFDAAFKEYVWVRYTEKNLPNIRSDFEIWKTSILSSSTGKIAIFRKDNSNSLRLLCSTRLLSLFFNSVLIMAVFIQVLNYDQMSMDIEEESDLPHVSYNEQYAFKLLVGCKLVQIVIGLILMGISMKWNIDRLCYKISFVCGMSVCILYVMYSCLDYLIVLPNNLVSVVFLIVICIFLMLPMRMDIYHYSQIAEVFPINNTYKVWTIAFVNCIEHFVHIFLLLQIYIFVSYAILLTGFGILYISYWLMKYMPNVSAIKPVASAMNNSKKCEFLKHTHIVHI